MNHFLKPTYFKMPPDFRSWLMQHHDKETELLVGFYKVSSNKPSITWNESVDQAICFGWIDGVRKSIDDESYCIRFTPRKSTSIWSAVNIKKVEELTSKGLMHTPGLEAFKRRKENKSRIYAYEMAPATLSKEFEKKFKCNKKAWKYFNTLPPSYTRTAIHWVMSAKREETRLKRLEELINDSLEGRKIKRLS
jgi:uncharacterized protein YdeI (YjbR/CyaY-like superfamily)